MPVRNPIATRTSGGTRLCSKEYFTKNATPRKRARPPTQANIFAPMNCSQSMVRGGCGAVSISTFSTDGSGSALGSVLGSTLGGVTGGSGWTGGLGSIFGGFGSSSFGVCGFCGRWRGSSDRTRGWPWSTSMSCLRSHARPPARRRPSCASGLDSERGMFRSRAPQRIWCPKPTSAPTDGTGCRPN